MGREPGLAHWLRGRVRPLRPQDAPAGDHQRRRGVLRQRQGQHRRHTPHRQPTSCRPLLRGSGLQVQHARADRRRAHSRRHQPHGRKEAHAPCPTPEIVRAAGFEPAHLTPRRANPSCLRLPFRHARMDFGELPERRRTRRSGPTSSLRWPCAPTSLAPWFGHASGNVAHCNQGPLPRGS